MTATLGPLVQAADHIRRTPGRNDKVALIAQALRAAADEVGLAAAYLAGDPPQSRLEVGWATLGELAVPAAAHQTLSLSDVDVALTALAQAGGPGSRTLRQKVLTDLYGAATAAEQEFLSHLILGDMRQGALTGLVVKGVAQAAAIPEAVVRRAVMLAADLSQVAVRAITGGRDAVTEVGLVVGRGVQPMLASTAESVTASLAALGTAVVEWKLDGARIQVHKRDDQVTVYTRNLNDITSRSAAVVQVVQALDAEALILDGEVLSMGPDGRPWAFQDTISAFSTDTPTDRAQVGLTPFFFDLLHHDGQDLIDEPLVMRRERLQALVPAIHQIPGAIVKQPEAGEAVLAQALERGHEGVMIKDLGSSYDAGRRGKAWRKVKPVKTLDLVVLAAEWGSGRRKGLLSNIHLGARDGDDLVMLGKTFKGMTDVMLAWQTERFLSLMTHKDGNVVYVRPEQVVEIAVDGIQVSRRYPGGVALRFARVLRYRDDKSLAQIDTLDTVKGLGTPSRS